MRKAVTASTREVARGYVRRGWSVVPVPRGQKAPRIAGWQTLRLTESDLPARFSNGENIGILTGEVSGNLIDVDLDAPEAMAAADYLLPATDLVHGRPSKPRSHRWYRVSQKLSYQKFADPCREGNDPKNATLIELRQDGHQTIVPPSEADGEVRTWDQEAEPAHVDGAELGRAVARVAAAALLARYWPKSGRHEARMALSGALARAGWSEQEVIVFVQAVVQVAQPGDRDAYGKVAGDTRAAFAKLLQGGAPVTGLPRLAELVGADTIRCVCDCLKLNPKPITVEPARGVNENWPDPPEDAAFYGLAGDIVRTIYPHTESSKVALLIQLLVCFGNMIGRTAHFVAERSQHFLNLFAVLVGVTSGGRKGSSWAQVLRLTSDVAPPWASEQVQSGLSSGEGLIWAVRDPTTEQEPIRKKGRVSAYQDIVTDRGVADKRVLVFESEFASPLRMMTRDGNILSVVIRQAWDTGILRTLTKNSPTKATDAHISIVGHVTRDELRRELSTTDMGNGFANRFLWICTARSKELPEGGSLSDEQLSQLTAGLRDAVAFGQTVGEMKRDDSIKEMWASIYHEVAAEAPGLLGAVISRAAPQIMRLACLYALLDHSVVVQRVHLLAAVALWKYCQDSARFIFGDALGDPTADTILRALRNAPSGLDRTAISSLFGRHKSSDEISRALALLQEHGLARVSPPTRDGTGRPSEVWFSVDSNAKEAK